MIYINIKPSNDQRENLGLNCTFVIADVVHTFSNTPVGKPVQCFTQPQDINNFDNVTVYIHTLQ